MSLSLAQNLTHAKSFYLGGPAYAEEFVKALASFKELEKVEKELKVLYLKNKIRIIAQKINKKEIEKEEMKSLQRQLSDLVKLLQDLNLASKNRAGVLK